MGIAKHTPGPWELILIKPKKEEGHDFEPRCYITAPNPQPDDCYSGDIRIADIPDPVGAVDEANARLMAASPKMLAALIAAHPFITDDKVRAEVGQAIVEATGE